MLALFVLQAALVLCFARGQTSDPPVFYMMTNGGTVACPLANVGDQGEVSLDLDEGRTVTKVFTKRDRQGIQDLIGRAQWSQLATTCTSGVTDMSNLFIGQDEFNEDISTWDTSAVTDMDAMFYDAPAFNQDISAWNTSMVTSCVNFAERTSSWTLPKPEFKHCTPSRFSLAANGITVLCPDAALGEKGTVQGKEYTKRDRKAVLGLTAKKEWSDLASTCTSGVTDMSNLFIGQDEFNEDISTWDTSAVTDMDTMFYDAVSFDQNISPWNTSSVESMDLMFGGAATFNQDLSSWEVGNVDTCDRFADGTSSWLLDQPQFTNCRPSKFYLAPNGITVLCPDAALLETGTVKGKQYTKRDKDSYYGLRFLAVDSTKWWMLGLTCTTGITDLSLLFIGAAVLDDVDLSSWDTSAVTDMNYMFAGMYLTSFSACAARIRPQAHPLVDAIVLVLFTVCPLPTLTPSRASNG